MELKQIILLAQKGDAAAFEQIVDEFYPQVFGLLCKWTGHWHDAEDLTQDTFLKAFKYLKSFRIDRNFKSWLYKIALNLANDYHSGHRERTQSVNLDETMQESLRYDVDADAGIERRQRLQRIYGAIPELTVRERSVFVLKAMEGLENHEIAEILGITQTTVRRFYGLARRKIVMSLERTAPTSGNNT